MKTKLKTLTMLACAALGSTACSERVNAMTDAEGLMAHQRAVTIRISQMTEEK